MLKKIVRKIVYIVSCILILVLAVLGLAVYNLTGWVDDNWGLLTIDEIIFHLKVPLQGTNAELVESGINFCVPSLILLFLIFTVFMIGFHNRKKSLLILFIGTLVMCGFSTDRVLAMGEKLGVKEYLKNQSKESELIQNEYVDPRNVEITFPEQKRNLIYIFLESMETTYMSRDVGGGLEYNCIPELTALAQNNVSFSNTDQLGGAYPTVGTTWTMGAMFAQTSGLPLKIDGDSNSSNDLLGSKMNFSTTTQNLEDILWDNGYQQCFMLGSDAAFGGRKAYFDSHGTCEIWDYNTAVEQGCIPEGYYEWWGYEDEKLFSYAKEKLLDMSSSSEPFNMTLLTVDTHSDEGYVCELCQDEFEGQYENVMACSSRQVADFVSWASQQAFYENTTIVLVGDHLTMSPHFNGQVEDYERRVYNTFINLPDGLSVSFEQTHNREFTTMDIFPTTIAALGAQISGDKLALGTNLFSDQQTLLEKYGKEELESQLSQKSSFYDQLMNDIDE